MKDSEIVQSPAQAGASTSEVMVSAIHAAAPHGKVPHDIVLSRIALSAIERLGMSDSDHAAFFHYQFHHGMCELRDLVDKTFDLIMAQRGSEGIEMPDKEKRIESLAKSIGSKMQTAAEALHFDTVMGEPVVTRAETGKEYGRLREPTSDKLANRIVATVNEAVNEIVKAPNQERTRPQEIVGKATARLSDRSGATELDRF